MVFKSSSRPTQRAADGGYAPRFLGIYLALGFFRFDGESPSHPPQLTQTVSPSARDNMKIVNKNISEIDFIPIIDDVMETKSWGFKLSYSDLREYHSGLFMRKMIYDSEWCRVQFEVYQRRNIPPDMYESYIWYGRLHAPNEDYFMIWQGEKCRCWHSVGSTHLFFLEGISPDEVIKNPKLPIFEAINSDIHELLNFPAIFYESQKWKYYGTRLFELFDLRRPDLWNQYSKYLEEYYKLLDEHFKSKGISPSSDKPPLWMVC